MKPRLTPIGSILKRCIFLKRILQFFYFRFMEDTFQVRYQFTELLHTLTTSKKSLANITHFAVKNESFSVDLYECLQTELTDVSHFDN